MNSAVVFALLATVAAASAGLLAPAPLAVGVPALHAPVAYASPFGVPAVGYAKAVGVATPVTYGAVAAPFAYGKAVGLAAPAIIG